MDFVDFVSSTDGCRLCLDPFAECFTTIENPQLKDQMEKVFCFMIEPKRGYCSGVCPSCSYAISEFYQYSKKVRQNQGVVNFDPAVDSKDALERVKIETFSDFTIDPVSLFDGCRLCLDPFAECFTTIENPELKDQMGKVFCFTIEPKQGYCSGVCHSCSFAITEFYQFSEKVRKNQEALSANVTNNNGPTVDSKIPLSEVREKVEDACEPVDQVSAEEVAILDPPITVKDIKMETFNDPAIPESATKNASKSEDKVSGEEEISCSGDNELYEPSSKKLLTKRERHKEDQLFNKHLRMICDLCGTSAETFTALYLHMKEAHNRRAYVVCCKKKLLDRSAMRDHINWHADPDLFRCETCGHKHTTKGYLKKHMRKMHSIDDYQYSFQCEHCPQSFVQMSDLVKHMKWHEHIKTNMKLPETIEEASGVEEPTLNSEIIIKNVKVEMISESGPPEMTDCAYDSKNEVSGVEEPTSSSEITVEKVKVELSTVNDGEPENEVSQIKRKRRPRKARRADLPKQTIKQRYKEDRLFNKHFRMICKLCGTVAATFTELRRHFWTEHNEPAGYVVCCNKKLINRTLIRDHIEFHSNPDAFQCKLCGVSLKTSSILNVHMLLQHTSAGAFKCDHCPQSFAEESALAIHLRRHRNMKCPKCPRTFNRKDYLNHHMTDCGQFTCDNCGKEFTSKRRFDRHMDAHMGIEVRRFRCKLCLFRMATEESLQNHMDNVHNEANRRFQCDICLQKYSRAKYLQQHRRITHAMGNIACEFCGLKLRTNRSLQVHRATHTDEMKSIS